MGAVDRLYQVGRVRTAFTRDAVVALNNLPTVSAVGTIGAELRVDAVMASDERPRGFAESRVPAAFAPNALDTAVVGASLLVFL